MSCVTNYELFFVEVKRLGKFANGTFESDLIKLGKEMQVALDKLVLKVSRGGRYGGGR
jgi:hypothetical protein